jgi:DNA-binding SARP family transcriptional activator
VAHLALYLLGPPEAYLDGEPVAGLASDKVRALLYYLALESDHAHRRESLAGLLWPDYPERSARTNLSNALSNLRTALGAREATPPYLHVSRETIQLNVQSDHRVDATAFGELVRRQQWKEAITLYRGPFLEGFSLPDSPAFEQWALVMRERLQHEVIATLERLTAKSEARGDYAHACESARRQLELEPWHEGAHRAESAPPRWRSTRRARGRSRVGWVSRRRPKRRGCTSRSETARCPHFRWPNLSTVRTPTRAGGSPRPTWTASPTG